MGDQNQVKIRTASFAFLVAMMLGALAALGAMLYLLRAQVLGAEDDIRPGLIRLAWICAVLIGVTLVLLAWAVVRFARFRARLTRTRPSPPHVDVWSVAGQRFQVPEQEGADEEGES